MCLSFCVSSHERESVIGEEKERSAENQTTSDLAFYH